MLKLSYKLKYYKSEPKRTYFKAGIIGSVALRRRPFRIELAQSLKTQPSVALVFLYLIRSFKQA